MSFLPVCSRLSSVGRLASKKVFAPRLARLPVRYASASPKELPQFLLNTPATKVTVLPNGMRVATEESHGETATVGVWIDAGSSYENEKNNGVAHFLEHMAFKGTGKRSQKQLEVEIENMGASLNAYTSREQTVYYARAFKGDVEKAVDVLADILQNSQLDPKNIERERDTILREMEEVEKNMEEVIFDRLHSVAYSASPLGYTILGPSENVKSIRREDLVNYISTHYTPDRMVLAGAGAVNHEKLVELGNKLFTKLPKASGSTVGVRPPTPYSGAMISVRDDEAPLTHMAFAVESVGWSHPDFFAFAVLQAMVGSWDRSLGAGKNISSRVCEYIASNNLAQSLMSFNTCYHNTGLFGAYAVTTGHHTHDVAYEIFNEWVRIGSEASPAEVERAKTKVKASCLMQLDGSSAVCEDIGRQLLTLNRRMSPAEIFMRIDAVDAATIRRVAYEHLNDVDPAVAVIGNLEEVPDYNQLRGWTYWNRL